jgi:hypothetical protein
MATQRHRSKPAGARPAVIMIGTDTLGKPHGSWFTSEEAENVARAAEVMGYRAVTLADESHIELAAKLPRGRFFAGGRAFVPFIKPGLYEKIRVFAERVDADGPGTGVDQAEEAVRAPGEESERGEVSASEGDQSKRPFAQAWDEIAVGSLVLGYDGPNEAWYEAIVIARDGDSFHLRWRDYPREGTKVKRRNEIALLYPTGA